MSCMQSSCLHNKYFFIDSPALYTVLNPTVSQSKMSVLQFQSYMMQIPSPHSISFLTIQILQVMQKFILQHKSIRI